jgi:acyl dehydratase
LIEGPYFDDLTRGMVFDTAPPVTLTEGGAALHRAIVGGRLPMPVDRTLSERVLGPSRWMAHPAYVWDVAIGQSTEATQNVMANLFYRGFVFRRTPSIGDTLHTVTEVVGLKANRDRSDRPRSGLVALRMTTRDQDEQLVLDFWRCAMLRRRGAGPTVDDDLASVGEPVDAAALEAATSEWDLHGLDAVASERPAAPLTAGDRLAVRTGDVVTSAPELARFTLNLAAVHHDESVSTAGRLVYGGHTIGLALAQASRALPGLLTVIAWHSCDHVGPVREGDTLHSTIVVESVQPLTPQVRRVHLRSRLTAVSGAEAQPRHVLDWRYVAIIR